MQVKMAIPRQSNRNPQFEREHSLDLQAGLPEESKRGKKERKMKQPKFSPYHTTHMAGHQHFVNWMTN